MKRSENKRILTLVLMLTLALALMAGCTQTVAPTGSATVATPSAAATSAADGAGQAAQIVKVSADEALAILKDQPTAILLDVRTEAEFAEGHIAGAQQLAVEELLDRTGELPADKNTPIVIYCRSGRRSALAAEQLAGLGYTTLYDLGGITSWPYDIVQ